MPSRCITTPRTRRPRRWSPRSHAPAARRWRSPPILRTKPRWKAAAGCDGGARPDRRAGQQCLDFRERHGRHGNARELGRASGCQSPGSVRADPGFRGAASRRFRRRGDQPSRRARLESDAVFRLLYGQQDRAVDSDPNDGAGARPAHPGQRDRARPDAAERAPDPRAVSRSLPEYAAAARHQSSRDRGGDALHPRSAGHDRPDDRARWRRASRVGAARTCPDTWNESGRIPPETAEILANGPKFCMPSVGLRFGLFHSRLMAALPRHVFAAAAASVTVRSQLDRRKAGYLQYLRKLPIF